jgi:hypothetical protein
MLASVQWGALLRGRLVADLKIDDPVLHLDRENLTREVEDETPLRERGWQEAVQAMYPLRVNQVVVSGGAVSYFESDRTRPLELSAIRAVVRNIRNRSPAPGAYSSPFEVEAVVFDQGRLSLEGEGDFLRVPHAAVKGDLALERMELDYFRPVAERYGLAVSSGELRARGSFEYAPEDTLLRLDELRIDGLRGDYVHADRTAERARQAAVATGRAAREVANEPGVLLEVRHMEMRDSVVSFVNEQATPRYRVFLEASSVVIENLSNQRAEGTATARIRGRIMGSGSTRVAARFRPESRGPDFDLDLSIEDTDLRSLNDVLRAHADVDVRSGHLSLYSEMRVKNGQVEGYVKPLFRDVEVHDPRQDVAKPLTAKLKEAAAELVAKTLRNEPREEVATIVPISGPVSDPNAGTLRTLVGLLRNAFVVAILPGFEHGRQAPAREE